MLGAADAEHSQSKQAAASVRVAQLRTQPARPSARNTQRTRSCAMKGRKVARACSWAQAGAASPTPALLPLVARSPSSTTRAPPALHLHPRLTSSALNSVLASKQ